MRADLAFPVEILGAPIVRERNGLAMSSRNQLLDAQQREQASIIHETLLWMRDRLQGEGKPVVDVEAGASNRLSRSGLQPDYAVIRRSEDLCEPVSGQAADLIALIAARLGSVRLIDNLQFGNG
jgi:pantoate--beta-alanine ligase